MLVGREPERKLVERLAAAARLGESGVLVVAGEAGIGKSALLEHATSLCDGMIVHRVVGSEVERDLAFGGLSQLLAGAVDDLDQLPDPQAHALGVALAVRTGTAVDRFAVGSATLGMLSRLAEVVPRAVLVDDAHLLDRPSAEAIAFVARRLVADPVLLVATVRTHEPTPFLDSGLQVVELTGLDDAAARALLGNRVAPTDLAHLVRATGGNPLALLELTEHPDDISGSWPEAPIAVPAKVGRAFLARTDQLSPASRLALLAAAASGGDRAVVAAASRLLGVDPVRLVDAVDAGLIRFEGQTIRFRHPLVRAAVYGGAPPADRRAVHAALGAETPEDDADRRAWHLAAAVPDTDDDAADGLAAVAERARSRAAYDVAATALERSARLSTSDDQRTRRLVAAAETAWIAGQGHRSRALLDEIGTPPADLVGRIGSLSGTIAARTGSLAEAVAVLVDTAARVAEGDPDAAVEMLADSVNAGFYRADTSFLAEALTRLEELLPQATMLRSRVLGTLALGMARTLLGQGGADEIRWAVGELVFSTEIRNDPMRTAWLVMGVLFLREEGAFRSVVEEAVAETRAGTVLGTLPYLLFHVARDDATTDRWQEAESGYHEGIRLARESGQTTDLAASLAGLAWLEGRQDKEESCRRHAAESIELCHRHDIVLGRIWAASALSELELARGDAAAALVQLEQVIALLTEFGVHDVDLYPGAELAETLLRLGRGEEARDVAADFLARSEAKGQPWARARAERAVALTGSDPEPAGRFERALSHHRETRDSFERARTELAYGAHLRRSRQRREARPVLRSALDTFELLGAQQWAEQTAVELEATGETVRRRGVDAREALTPQERQISRLLASGQTTRQAAATLFLSPKTVEYHLRHVYLKLGIGSRAELASAISTYPEGA